MNSPTPIPEPTEPLYLQVRYRDESGARFIGVVRATVIAWKYLYGFGWHAIVDYVNPAGCQCEGVEVHPARLMTAADLRRRSPVWVHRDPPPPVRRRSALRKMVARTLTLMGRRTTVSE